MKFYKPHFSIIVILIQLVLSIREHYQLQEARKANQELFELINIVITYKTLFLFVLIIGFYEMTTKPGWFKILMRVFLVCIVLGTHFAGLIPIDQFYYGVYNTAWFFAIVASVLILYRIVKYFDDEYIQKRSKSH